MNYKNRLKNLEKKLPGIEIQFHDLLKPEYVYTGKPFINPYKAIQSCGVVELPPFFRNEQLQILYEKGILSFSIDETIQAMKENI